MTVCELKELDCLAHEYLNFFTSSLSRSQYNDFLLYYNENNRHPAILKLSKQQCIIEYWVKYIETINKLEKLQRKRKFTLIKGV